jgi:Mn2+/Fe2+ NRAMP family transporter
VSYLTSKSMLIVGLSSYGNIFLKALLFAADRNGLGLPLAVTTAWRCEILKDNVFNVRSNQSSLNLDFPSYAAYIAVGEDPRAILNRSLLLNQTQRIFTLFFQHFVSLDVDIGQGGWAYQQIGASLDGIGPFADAYISSVYTPPTGYRQLNTNRTAGIILPTRIEGLELNPVATWLSIAILVCLCLVGLLVAVT